MKPEIEEKTTRLVAMLRQENLAGVLLNGQHNFAWLTGGASNGIDLSRDNGAATLFVTSEGKRYVLANDIEMPRLLTEQISQNDFEPVEFSWQDEKTNPGLVFEKASSLSHGGLGSDLPFDPRSRVIEGSVSKCRHRLTPEELDRFRRLGSDAGAAMDSLAGKLSPGESESEIAEKLRGELGSRGITSVVTLVAADERIEKYRHPIPTDNRWSKTLLLVTCAKRAGLIASLSRIISVGVMPDELGYKTEATAFVNARLWNATQFGASGAELYQVAADAYREKGFAKEIDNHHQGGAAGYRTREWVAHPKSTEIVQTDQAFAWNPSITGTKVEETCVVSPNGIEVVTASASFPQISTIINGQEFLSPGILTI